MEWISCEKEMPEHGEAVLGYHPDWGIRVVYAQPINKEWPMPIGFIEDSATHWMPLPEPPSEG